jgi:phosphopentomutase
VESGLIFTNLVEFDSVWGHRNDAKGYKEGLEQFDERLPEIIRALRDEDVLIINADHGCDPTTEGTDHTREYIPVLVYGKNIKGNVDLGVLDSFADIGQTIADILECNDLEVGNSFLDKVRRG